MKRILSVFMAALVLLSACSKDESPTDGGGNSAGSSVNQFTINGDGFNNRTFSIPSIPGVPALLLPLAVYRADDIATGVSMLGLIDQRDTSSTGAGVSVNIPGNVGTRTVDIASTPNAMLIVIVGTRSYVALNQDGQRVGTGSLRITKYEGVDGLVEGEFSGTLVLGGNAGAPSVTITNGKFRARRLPDEN
jgi:hypothetical protein